MINRKKLALGAGALATIGAAGTLAAGVTFGLFSATPQTQSNTFASGTVSLGSNATANCTTTEKLAPGESETCTFTVTYGGNLPAHVGLDVVPGSTGLNAGDTPLTYEITDEGANPYTPGEKLFVADDDGGETHTFTVVATLPSEAGNDYQGLEGSLTLTAYAVQSSNNGTCTDPGTVCDGVSWS